MEDCVSVSEASVTDQVVDLIPALRAFAWTLCRDRNDADELVQETLLKAVANIDKFKPGTRLRAWLFTIMRNTFFTRVKIAARERTGSEDCVAGNVTVAPTQEWSIRGKELFRALDQLPPHYRETFILVVMLGESYEGTAEICGCRVGTVKSRVSRARQMVIEEIGAEA